MSGVRYGLAGANTNQRGGAIEKHCFALDEFTLDIALHLKTRDLQEGLLDF